MTPDQRAQLIKAAFLDAIEEIVAGKREMMKEAQAQAARGILGRVGQWLGIGATPAARAMGIGSLKRFAAPVLGAYGMGALGSGSINPASVLPWMVQHPFMTAAGGFGGAAMGGLGRGVAGMMPGAARTFEQTAAADARAMAQADLARGVVRPYGDYLLQSQQALQRAMTGPGGEAISQGMLRAGAPRYALGAGIALPVAAFGGMSLLGKGKEAIMGGDGGGGGLFGGGGGSGMGFIPNLALSGLGGYGGYQAGEALGLPWYGKWGLGALGATMTPQLVGSMVGGPGGGAMPTPGMYGY